jgi:DNA polymerase I-like protein with 3'-5' exonuclease and polymerase domains
MQILGCSKREAENLISDFFEGNPGLKKLMDHLSTFYKKYKYIKAIDGRHLFIRSAHVLLNSLIQASAAVIFKQWGCNIWREIDTRGLDAVIIIAMHDEYQLRVHKDQEAEVFKMLKETLQEVKEMFNLKVDIATDSKSSNSWAGTH